MANGRTLVVAPLNRGQLGNTIGFEPNGSYLDAFKLIRVSNLAGNGLDGLVSGDIKTTSCGLPNGDLDLFSVRLAGSVL